MLLPSSSKPHIYLEILGENPLPRSWSTSYVSPFNIYLRLSLSLSHTKTFARSTLAFCNLSRETEIQGVGTWNKSPCISIHTSRIEFPLQQISFHQIQLLPSSQTASAFRAEKDGGSSIANREYPISRSRRKRRTAPIFAERSLTSRRVIREQVQSALFFRRLGLMKSLDRVRHVDRVRHHLVLYQTAKLRTESAVRSPQSVSQSVLYQTPPN